MQLKTSACMTPEQYAQAITSLSRRFSDISVFPGNNYIDIGEWMLQDHNLLGSVSTEDNATLFASKSEHHHDLVVVYSSNHRRWDIQQYSQKDCKKLSVATLAPEHCSNEVVFIRGFISPSWISGIASKYRIDPEFFRQHMDFLSVSADRHAYSSPSLATASNNIIRLCVSTTLHHDRFAEQDLPKQWRDQSVQLETYKVQQLGSSNVCCGDSLVREYSTLCSSCSVLEQWISIRFTRSDKGWAVIVWMDQGRPLETSPPCPWTGHVESKATALPVLHKHPKMAFRTTTNRLEMVGNAVAPIQQSATILPLQYDSLIALVDLAHRAPRDPLSVSIPLFAQAAFSEAQFLNLMESKIQMQIKAVANEIPADALGAFQYFSNILDRHVRHLKDGVHALHNLMKRDNHDVTGNGSEALDLGPQTDMSNIPTNARPSHAGPNISLSDSHGGSFTATGLLTDYEDLHVRCTELSKMCTRGITLAMN